MRGLDRWVLLLAAAGNAVASALLGRSESYMSSTRITTASAPTSLFLSLVARLIQRKKTFASDTGDLALPFPALIDGRRSSLYYFARRRAPSLESPTWTALKLDRPPSPSTAHQTAEPLGPLPDSPTSVVRQAARSMAGGRIDTFTTLKAECPRMGSR